MKESSRKGFTLIELVIVIVVLGILAAIAIVKYVDIKNEAYLNKEKYMIGCVKEALAMEYARAQANSTTPGYPNDPFTLLSQPPPVVYESAEYDNISWHVDFQEHNTYLITCPHGKLRWYYFITDPATGETTGEIQALGDQSTH